jgi:hypothetical protein
MHQKAEEPLFKACYVGIPCCNSSVVNTSRADLGKMGQRVRAAKLTECAADEQTIIVSSLRSQGCFYRHSRVALLPGFVSLSHFRSVCAFRPTFLQPSRPPSTAFQFYRVSKTSCRVLYKRVHHGISTGERVLV